MPAVVTAARCAQRRQAAMALNPNSWAETPELRAAGPPGPRETALRDAPSLHPATPTVVIKARSLYPLTTSCPRKLLYRTEAVVAWRTETVFLVSKNNDVRMIVFYDHHTEDRWEGRWSGRGVWGCVGVCGWWWSGWGGGGVEKRHPS